MTGFRVAVVGATGAVGREMWRLLQDAPFPIGEIRAYTSPRSQGRRLPFRGELIPCRALAEDTLCDLDLVLASAGSTVSREWLPRFAERGARVIDNSSAFRMQLDCPLVVPEINGDALTDAPGIIANPNCSTIQLVVALHPLHCEWTLQCVRVATYQAASGAGDALVESLRRQSRELLEDPDSNREASGLAFNVVPHIGDFDDAGESFEERKMRNEMRRILDLPDLGVSATCVRVPVFRGHSEAVWSTYRTSPDVEHARKLLTGAPGVAVEDDPGRGRYPLPRTASGRPEVFVGRIRRDAADPQGLCLWVVSDNLLKGAATNAFQIAEALVERGLLSPGRPA